MPIPGDGSIKLQVNSIDIRVNEDLTGRVRVTSSESSGSTSRLLSDTCYFEKVDQENIHRILSNSQEKEPILESELISRKEKSSES